MSSTHPAAPGGTEQAPDLTADQCGQVCDALLEMLELETRRIAQMESDGLPPSATRDLLELVDSIRAALAKLDDGVYGRCESCNAAIPFERLEAVPYARCCISCQAGPVSMLG